MTVPAAPAAPVAHGAPGVAPVPFAAELQPLVDAMAANPMPPLTEENLRDGGAAFGPGFPDGAGAVAGRAVSAEELVIPGPEGSPDLEITVFRPTGPSAGPLPILVNFHGGGMIVGHRSWEHGRLVDLVETHGAIGVNVEYRLAPEHPSPAGLEDCYAALLWLHAHAAELGVDADRIIVGGGSAGGCLAAGVALLARDRQGPALAGQLLLCPMLDNTNTTVSSLQYDGIGTWQREANLLAWSCLLGDDLAFSPEASGYAAPTHAADVSHLAPAFIEVGEAEMFRDEDTQYALRIWATGGQAELHVWGGGAHGFDMYMPDAEISRAALAARASWLGRIWGA